MARVPSFLAFVAVLVACLAGAFSLSWWLACAAAAMLMLVSLNEPRPAYNRSVSRRYASQAHVGAPSMPLLGGTLNAATAAAIGFALGRAIAWVWIWVL